MKVTRQVSAVGTSNEGDNKTRPVGMYVTSDISQRRDDGKSRQGWRPGIWRTAPGGEGRRRIEQFYDKKQVSVSNEKSARKDANTARWL